VVVARDLRVSYAEAHHLFDALLVFAPIAAMISSCVWKPNMVGSKFSSAMQWTLAVAQPRSSWSSVGTEITFAIDREGVYDPLREGITTNTKAPTSTVECAQSMLVQLKVNAMSRSGAMGNLAGKRSSYETAQRTRVARS
jgi:hypothetical protein